MTDTQEKKSFIDLLEEINSKLDEKEKAKKFHLPWKAKIGKPKIKKGFIVVMKINENRQIQFQKMKIDDQTILVDGAPRIATPEEIVYYKGKPWIILPSWSKKPFSPTDNYEGVIAKNYGVQGSALLLSKMKREAMNDKKPFNSTFIWLLLAAAGLAFLAYKAGWIH